jgi:polyisoprenoid-binding protein YceI
MRVTKQGIFKLFRGSMFQNVQESNANLRMKRERLPVCGMRIPLTIFLVLASAVLPSVARAEEAPVFVITPENSSVTFFVQASVSLKGTFDKWDSTLTFTSPEVETGVLTLKIQADSVNTGSGMKDGKLKSKEFFNVEQDPLITFVSKKFEQTGPNTFQMTGDFTIRGVTKTETLSFTAEGQRGSGAGTIKGTMSFNRKDFGMNKGIPFVKISDHVDVTVNLKVKKTSGPILQFKQ